jgi:hypothetical protein
VKASNQNHDLGLGAYRKQAYAVLIPSLLLVGIAFIAWSFALPHGSVAAELLKELGVVLISVFGVSILYEIFIAEKHFRTFGEILAGLVERGETNAAICARLGILQIFPTRRDYMQRYGFEKFCSEMKHGSNLRIVGTTLFAVMVQADSLMAALKRGATVELALLDREAPDEVFEQLKHNIKRDELRVSLERFEELKSQISVAAPAGSLELRMHKTPLFDTLAEFQTEIERFSVWDISFGADATKKRIFLLDPDKPFAQDYSGPRISDQAIS